MSPLGMAIFLAWEMQHLGHEIDRLADCQGQDSEDIETLQKPKQDKREPKQRVNAT